MKFLFLFLLLVLKGLNSCDAQVTNELPEYSISLLKEEFPEHKIFIQNSVTKLSFKFKGPKVVVLEKTMELLYSDDPVKTTRYFFLNEKMILKTLLGGFDRKHRRLLPFEKKVINSMDIFSTGQYSVSYIASAGPSSKIPYGFPSYHEHLIEYTDPQQASNQALSQEYPTLKKEIVIEIPEWLELEIIPINMTEIPYKIDTVQKRKKKIITITSSKIPPERLEKYSPGYSGSFPHLILAYKKVSEKGKDSSFVISDSDDLYRVMSSYTKEVNNERGNLEPIVYDLIKDAKNDNEKIKTLFYWVQDNIRYIAFEEGIKAFMPDGAYSVYTKKYGDCKGMANLLKVMLQIAGFDARLTWIGTRGVPYDFSIPYLGSANHMICAVKRDSSFIFLDATEKEIPLDYIANRISDRPVMIENGESFFNIKTPSRDHNTSFEKTIHNLALDGRILKGEFSKYYFGENKTEMMRILSYTARKGKTETIEINLKENIDFSVDTIWWKNDNRDTTILEISAAGKIENTVFNSNGKTIIQPITNHIFKMYLLDSSRICPVLFPYECSRTFTINLTIPDSMKVEFIPSSKYFETKDFIIGLYYNKLERHIRIEQEVILLNASMDIQSNAIFSARLLETLIAAKQNIVLSTK